MAQLNRIFFMTAIGIVVFYQTLMAAQDGTVLKDNSPVREEPNLTSNIIDYLQEGDDIRISSFPVNGEYYKVRARNGQYGWIHRKYLSVEQMSEQDALALEGKMPEPEPDRLHFVKALGGVNFFKPQDLNDVFSFNELNTGYLFGLEAGLGLGPRFSFIFRAEALTKNVVAKESNSGYIYNIGVRSYPLMVGIDFKFLKDPPIKLSVSVLGGVGFRTSFSAEALNLDPPNQSTIIYSPFTTLAMINVIRPLGRMFSVSASGGYRLLKTPLLETNNNNNGGQVFKVSGDFVKRRIDLSGFLVQAGLAFHF